MNGALDRNRNLATDYSPSKNILLISLVALLAGILSEIGRVTLKGSDYAYSTVNDIHYYTAMAFRLWLPANNVENELKTLTDTPDVNGFFDKLTPKDVGQTGFYWHAENGFAHQPPFAYRVLTPTLTGWLDAVGLGLNLAQLILYLIGVLLLAVFSYNLVGRSFKFKLAPILVSSGATFAALATVSPGYPDMTYLGLATAAVWAASRHLVLVFSGMALLTSLTRETGILLFLVWIAYAWSAKKLTVINCLPALVPLFGYVAVRLLVQVPEPDIKYRELFDFVAGRISPALIYGVFSIIAIGFITPRISRLFLLGVDKKLAVAESIIWIVGAFAALVSMLLATNTTRFALLSLPLFFAASGWLGTRSSWWLVSVIAATVGYATADILANRADPPFGQTPWMYVAFLVISLQIIALFRDRRIGIDTSNRA
jgi:hypothetical protein